ncbi:TonB-dependent receptor [Congregibacter sp.]|uniref:TonB-dependent receptor n=1 Tax=Congregibacter sp. TaxID=2744308 RepID=UPI0038588C88
MTRKTPVFQRTLIAASISAVISTTAYAQGSGQLEEVLITGSFIKSTGENEASPVEVLDSDYIANTGAITIGELTSRLSVSSGAENNPDSFTAGETQGTSNVNLRGLGLTSTLVLINGKRQTMAAAVANDGSVFVDTSTVPMAALQRVEILKEGATATYGSDAIAGVVNFILREDFEGFELSGGYQTTATDSQDTSDVNALAGFALGDSTNLLLSATFRQQDPLSSADRPYTTENAISSLGRSFIAVAPGEGVGDYAGSFGAFETIPDPNCVANGGAPGPAFTPAGGGRCGFLYGPRFNLVNEEEQTQLYGNLTHDFANDVAMTVELGWTHHEVLDNPQSPSYPNLAFPLIFPGQAGSPFNVPVLWYGRPLGSEAPSPLAPRDSETIRASIDFEGSFNSGWDWYTALTYSSNVRQAIQPDTIKSRLEAGLRGEGGASGTETFSPFDPNANSPELIDYISTNTFTERTTEMLVGDVVFSGELFEMAAGPVGAAFGAQWREEGYEIERNEIYTQQIDPDTGLAIPVDLIFLGGGVPVDESRSSYAVFAEANIPLTDSIEVDLAARYEDLESGSSIDPKIAVRWQASDSIVLRASASSAFREPSLQQFYSQETSLQGLADPLNPGGAVFVRVDTAGTLDVEPEESTNFNFGAVFTPTDDLTFRIDYWRFDYQDVIVSESAQGKLNDDPNGDSILRLGGPGGQLQGVITNYVNAASVETDGIDVSVDWTIPTANAGMFGFNLNASHFLSYEIPCTGPSGQGCVDDTGVQDVAGFFNYDNFARSIPETKINGVLDWTMGNHKLAVLGFYTSGYETTRAVPAAAAANGFSQDIDSWLTVDLQYVYNFNLGNTDAALTLGSKNVFDEEAPRAWDGVNFSFDPKHHDPRGQLFYARVKFNF